MADFLAKKTQPFNYCRNSPSWTPPIRDSKFCIFALICVKLLSGGRSFGLLCVIFLELGQKASMAWHPKFSGVHLIQVVPLLLPDDVNRREKRYFGLCQLQHVNSQMRPQSCVVENVPSCISRVFCLSQFWVSARNPGYNSKGCEPFRELQESLGASGPEVPKKVWKRSPGASGLGVPKSLEKVSKKPWTDIFQTFSRLFGPPRASVPGRPFPDLFGISGPEGPRDSCSSREGSQSKGVHVYPPPTINRNTLSTSKPGKIKMTWGLVREKKKQHKHKLFGPNFLRTFPTHTPGCPGVKKFLPITGPQENPLLGADGHDFRRGRPRPEGFSKNFVQKKFALIFRPLARAPPSPPNNLPDWHCEILCKLSKRRIQVLAWKERKKPVTSLGG